MSDTISSESVAQDQLRAFIERIERLEKEKKAIADDIREVYAEAKDNGFSTAVMHEIIKLRKKDHAERMEFEATLDLYMAALGMQPAPRDDDDFDPPPRGGPQPGHHAQALEARSLGEITESRPADAPVASDAGRPSGDEDGQQFEPLPETVAQEVVPHPQAQRSSFGRTEPSADGQTNSEGARSTHILDQSAAARKDVRRGKAGTEPMENPAPLTQQGFATPDGINNDAGRPQSATLQSEMSVGAGPSGVDTLETAGTQAPPADTNSPATATEPGTEAAGAPAIAEDATRQERSVGTNPPILSLRPHCLHPDCCGSGGGKNHCFSCRKAAWLNGVEAA